MQTGARYFCLHRSFLFSLSVTAIVMLVISVQQGVGQGQLTIKGVVRNSDGPLKNRVVMYLPIDESEGKPVTVFTGGNTTLAKEGQRKSAKEPWMYTYSIVPARGTLQNPRVLSNEVGEFSLVIPNFRRPSIPASKTKVAIGVFSGTADNPTISSHEIEFVDVEVNSTIVEAKAINFKAIKDKDPKP